MRLLVLCTHNSARSQMAEGWLRHHAARARLGLEVQSAGTEATSVKPEAIEVMREVGIEIAEHASKSLYDLPDPWRFDIVLTVCDSANKACPFYPFTSTRLHVSIADPSGEDLSIWRSIRDELGEVSRRVVAALVEGRRPEEEELRRRSEA